MMISAACALYFAYKYYDAKLCVKRLKNQSLHNAHETIRHINSLKTKSDRNPDY